jgi:hypothetical protein
LNNKKKLEIRNVTSKKFIIIRLIQKYQNFMKELENNHHQETIKLDKASKLKSTMNFSRTSVMSNMSRALQPKN